MLGGISIWQLLIILLLVVLLFGTKKLRNLGSDLGGAFKGFKKSMANSDSDNKDTVEGKQVGSDATQKGGNASHVEARTTTASRTETDPTHTATTAPHDNTKPKD